MDKQPEFGFFTYAHLRLSDKKIFYIGKGSKNRADSNTNRNRYWHNTVRKHGLITQILAYWKSEQEAFEHERLLIWCFRKMGFSLTNMTDGGEGLSNPSKEVRLKMSKNNAMKKPEVAAKNTALRTGKKLKPLTLEVRQKISKSKKGKIVSSEHRAKLSAAQTGRIFSPTHIANKSISAKASAQKGWETRRKNQNEN